MCKDLPRQDEQAAEALEFEGLHVIGTKSATYGIQERQYVHGLRVMLMSCVSEILGAACRRFYSNGKS